jgi:hypothetical protein
VSTASWDSLQRYGSQAVIDDPARQLKSIFTQYTYRPILFCRCTHGVKGLFELVGVAISREERDTQYQLDQYGSHGPYIYR